MAVAKYTIEVNIQKQRIPTGLFFRNWVASESLQAENNLAKENKVVAALIEETLRKKSTMMRGNFVFICLTCKNYVKKGQTPPLAIINGLWLDDLPSCLDLNELEKKNKPNSSAS